MKMQVITLDFETYYSKKEKYSLAAKGMTYEKYIRDERFEVIGLAVKEGNRPTQFLAPHEVQDWLDHIEIAYGWDNVRVVAQNAVFDGAILSLKYGINPRQIADTMGMSKAIQQWDGNSLDNITRQLRDKYGWVCVKYEDGSTWQGVAVGDNEQMLEFAVDKGTEVHDADGKHLMDFTDEEYDAYAEYCKTDVDLTYSAYKFFLDHYKFPEDEIEVMTTAIEMYTYPVMELDKAVLEEVKKNVNEHRGASLARAGVSLEDVRSDAKFAGALRALGVEPPTKINTKGETKYAFAKKDLAFLALLEHEDENVRELAQARFDNKSSQAVTRVEDFLGKSERGKLCVGIEYYGARTGRFGGFEGNLQNLNRNKLVGSDTPQGRLVFYKGKADRFVKMLPDGKVMLAKHGVVDNEEDELHEVGLRDSVKAPKGKVLVVNDLSQIEARTLAFMAGEQWVIDAFVAKKDIYKATAAQSFGIAYEEVTKAQRFVGKSQVLGLGYQAGVNGLKVALGKKSEEFADEELQMWVNSYRASVPNIVKYWRSNKRVLDAMCSGMNVQVDSQGILVQDGNTIIMPNGMRLVYRGVEKRSSGGYGEFWYWGRNTRTKKPDWEKTFQGRLVENCIAEGTKVLTDRGWVEIQDITLDDKVHDGVEFVTHKGNLCKSIQSCVSIDGVFMTEDHEVLTDDGWKQAGVLLSERSTSSIQRLDGETLREIGLPNAVQEERTLALELSVRLRKHSYKMHKRSNQRHKERSHAQLRLLHKRNDPTTHYFSRNVKAPDLLGVAVDESSLYKPESTGVAQLRRQRDNGLQGMARQVRELSSRYGRQLLARSRLRPYRQRQGLLQRKLSLGGQTNELQHPSNITSYRSGRRAFDDKTVLSKVQLGELDSPLSLEARDNNAPVGGETRLSKKVYDILDCGPRHRFVVLGDTGPFIVHNCTQGLARIVLTTQMGWIKNEFRKRGWTRNDAHLAMQVHDEVICCCKEELADEVFEIMQSCMGRSPDWCKDLPLASDGDIAKRYGCAK